MITNQDIDRQVRQALGADVQDFDVAGIVAEIQQTYGLVDIDAIDTSHFWTIVENHAL